MDNEPVSEAQADAESSLGVRLTGVENLIPHYVNLITSNFDSAAFQIVFGQVLPPVVTMPGQEEELALQGYIEGPAVARLIFTPTMLEQTIQNLTTQLENYRRQSIVDTGETGDRHE